MDLSAFRAQIEASRSFEHQVDGASFRLKLPSDHAWRLAFESNRDANGHLLEARMMRALLDVSLVGWDGVKTTHVLPDAEEAPLPFSGDARSMLLDARQDIADELAVAFGLKLKERRAKKEAATKN